jgi:glutamate-5-semialdehyde dehydrogenase
MSVKDLGKLAKKASLKMAILGSEEKNQALKDVAEALLGNKEAILAANAKDMEKAEENGVRGSLLDRLLLTEDRIEGIAEGVRQTAALNDPVGEVLWMRTHPNGMVYGQKRVPIGVLGMIYEARPNVTVDAFALSFKSGNAVILRGGKEAFETNQVFVKIIKEALTIAGSIPEAVQMLEDPSRETARELMQLNEYLDVLIPRGGAGLIQSVIENASVPVIETGVGNCHIYVDASADLEKAKPIVINAKVQRPGVCNALETLLVHESVADEFLPAMIGELEENGVEMHGDERVCGFNDTIIPATEWDWANEYLDLKLAIRIVPTLEAAIEHIATYSTKHSEAILTESYSASQKFLNEVDAAAVYVNASTRFTDGSEFGFGAEIGISTQKLHARGPMGVEALTTTKYIIYGSGQIRD